MSKVVPEGWKLLELDDVTDKVLGGGTPSRLEPSYWNGDIPWVSVKDLSGIRLTDTEESITSEGLANSASRLIPANTAILATRMAVGKLAYFDRAVAINQDLKAFFPKKNLDWKFFLQWYLSKSETIAGLATGSTVKGIRLEDLRSLPIKLPPFSEQQKIATILSSVDNVIEKTRTQIDKLKDLKTGMMQELLTKGIGHTEFKDSSIGRIPAEWSVQKIDSLVTKVGSGVTPRGGSEAYVSSGVPLIRSQNVYADGLRLSDVAYITIEQHEKMASSQLKPGDVLLNITGASIGRSYYLPDNFEEGNVNQHVCIIRPKQKTLNSIFLSYILSSELGQRQIMALQAGGNREGLNFKQVREISFALPTLEEQLGIVSVLQAVDIKLHGIKRKLENIKRAKEALMQGLLTGVVRAGG